MLQILKKISFFGKKKKVRGKSPFKNRNTPSEKTNQVKKFKFIQQLFFPTFFGGKSPGLPQRDQGAVRRGV